MELVHLPPPLVSALGGCSSFSCISVYCRKLSHLSPELSGRGGVVTAVPGGWKEHKHSREGGSEGKEGVKDGIVNPFPSMLVPALPNCRNMGVRSSKHRQQPSQLPDTSSLMDLFSIKQH